MTRAVLALAVLLLASCKEKTPPLPPVVVQPPTAPTPPPPAPKLPGCAVLDVTDQSGQKLESVVADQLELVVRESKRFLVTGRKEYQDRRKADQPERLDDPLRTRKPGRVDGVDWLFVGTLTKFSVKHVKKAAGGPADPTKAEALVEIGLDLKLVDAGSSEIVSRQYGETSRQGSSKELGIRIIGIGAKELKVDADSQSKLLRAALDEAFKRMLPDIDEKFKPK